MALYHHFMLLQTFLKYFQRRINLKVKKNMYSKKNKCSRSGKILRKGGDPPHRGGGLPSEGGGMTSSVRCLPPSPPRNGNPASCFPTKTFPYQDFFLLQTFPYQYFLLPSIPYQDIILPKLVPTKTISKLASFEGN